MSWLEDHLSDGIKDVLCEPDAPAAPKIANNPAPTPQWMAQGATFSPAAIPAPVAPFIVSTTSSNSAGTVTVTSSAVSSILTDLRSKTNFDATPVGQQLKESLDALADTGMSAEKMAVTALKLSHQSPAQVVSVLQGLQAVLVAEKQHFEASMETATTAEVSSRRVKSATLQSSIEAAEAQLASMRQDKAQVDSELQDKQNKISSARANYAAASEARNTEITDMISHYQSIPEVK